MKKNYDTIVIGSGCGGAATAALTSYLGHKTLLLEKNLSFGGRASTYERDGFKFDHGHIIMRCEKGPHGEVLRLAKREHLIPKFSHCPTWPLKATVGGLLTEYKPTLFTALFFPTFYKQHLKMKGNLKDALGFLRFGITTFFKTEKGLSEIDHTDLKSYFSKYSTNPYLHLYLGALSSVAFGASSQEASAGEMVRVMQKGMRDFFGMGYPINGEGVSAIPNSFLRAARELDCEIKSNTPVEKIIIEKGEATGVRIGGETIHAKNIVSAIGIKETLTKLAGRENFHHSYVNRIENLKYSIGGISLKYALKKKITDMNWGGEIPENVDSMSDDMKAGRIPEKFPVMFVTPSNIDPQLAPPGTQVMSFISGGPAVPPGSVDWSEWVDRVKAQMEAFFPGLKENTIYCDISTPDDIAKFTGRTFGDAVGVSQTTDQVGTKRPSPISPVKNLYYAGADVGKGCCATELASESAIALYHYFKLKQNERNTLNN